MAYKITQHRRGTLEEWRELNLVPAEGELIIVEFPDNVCKCKIGNGITCFSELPYITDWVIEELADKIEALRESTGESLTFAISEISQQIEALSTKQASELSGIRASADEKFSELTSSISSLSDDLSKVDNMVKTLVEPAVGALDAKYSDELSRLAEQHEADKKEFKLILESKKQECVDSAHKAVEQATVDFANRLSQVKAELTADYTNEQVKSELKLQKDLASIAQISRGHSEAIGNIQKELTDLADEVPTQIDKKILASESKTNTSIKEIFETLQQINFVVEQLKCDTVGEPTRSYALRNTSSAGDTSNLSTLVEQLEDLQYELNALELNTATNTSNIQNISSELARLATSLTNLSTQQKTVVTGLNAAISNLDAKLSKADLELNAAIVAHDSEVDKELANLAAADTILYQVIYKIQDTLIKKIETADSALQVELTDDISRMNQSIADMKLKLNTQLTQVQTDLANNLADTKADLTKKIERLDKLHGTKLDTVTLNLSTLSSTVATNQTNVNAALDSIIADTTDNTLSINNNSRAISQVGTLLDSKVALINAGIDAVNTKIDTKTLDVENRLQTQITAANSATQRQAELIAELQDKFGDLLEDIDHKIADKILEQHSDTDAAIADLQLAVKQINIILDQLEGSSSSTVTAEVLAVLNKINEDLVDLAADDVVLYQIIYRVRDELIALIDTTDKTVRADLINYKDEVSQNFSAFESGFDAKLAKEKSYLDTKITDLEERTARETSALYITHSAKINDNKAAIANLTATVANNKAEVKSDIAATNERLANTISRVSTNQSTINTVNKTLDDKISLVNLNIDALNKNLKAQDARISSLMSLEPGSTTGDAECDDIRTGYDGTIHKTAGDAVRAVGNDLLALDRNVKKLEDSLSQYIGSQAVDGLHYDINGEVGLGQPYMLYLKAGNEILQDSGVQVIGGSGGSGGGGGASKLKVSFLPGESSDVKIVAGANTIIGFIFEGEDSSGDMILSASATWRIDGVIVERGTIKYGENYFDVTKYLKTGTTKVHLTVSDDNGGTVTKSWTVQSLELTLTSNFNDKRTYGINERIIFSFEPKGAVKKTAIFKLDGEELPPLIIEKEVSGSSVSYELPTWEHGARLLEMHLEADVNGNIVKTDPIFKDIIRFDPTSEIPVIGTAIQDINVKQYSTTNIVYTVYDPKNTTPTVKIEIDGTIVSTQTIQSNKDYSDTPTAVYPYVAATPDEHTIKLICGTAEKVIKVYAENININISPVTAGLAFDFNPVGRNNSDANRLWSQNDVHLSVLEGFDWVNGGYLPNDPDGPCFCVKAGSTAIIDYKLFANEARVSGKDVKLVFKTKNVANPDAVFLSCIDNTTDKDHIGIKMGVQGANIYGKDVSLDLVYSEEDVIEFEFNISSDGEAIPMIMGYEDGVPSRPVVYNTKTSSFQQNSAKVITLGSPDCDLYIYRFKVYETSLSAQDILRNFIADARTTEEMVDRYNRNQIYDETGSLTAEALAEKCPWLRIYKISAPHFTNNKSDKVSSTTIQQIYKAGDPVLDNWVCYNAQHSGQGTSSNNYGAAGRNLDFIMNLDDSYFILGDGSRPDNGAITLTRDSIPVAYLNAKVNIASSNNLTNAILANRYNKFNPYARPFVDSQLIETDKKDTAGNTIKIKPKDTMEFHNCVIFIRETDQDPATHREFADNDWHFYAIGNIGDSKKTDKTRLTDPSDPYECCVEIMDVGLPLSAFPYDTMINAMGYTVDEKTGEHIYTWAKNENLGILYERQYSLTQDTTVNLNKTYYTYIDGKMSNAMEYTVEEVRDYLWAKDENLELLYEFIDGNYIKTTDSTINFEKTYYIETDIKDDNGIVVDTVFTDAMSYTIKNVRVYTWAKNENLDKLYEISYSRTSDTTVDFNKTYYVDILEHDDFSEDYTYGWRYISNKKNADIVAGCKQAWIDFYRFVTTTTDEEFKANLKYYFAEDSALYYYLFTTRYCMVDNRAKNTFWHYGKALDENKNSIYQEDIEIKNTAGDVLFSAKAGDPIRKWDLCWDYDNDTSLGLNNFGKQVYRYGLEDIDYDESNKEVFRQSNSLFFCRIRDLYASELKQMYNTLESADAWNANVLINESDKWQEEFPEELWRVDIERKYIRTYSHSFIDGEGDKQFLNNMANGKMKYHRRQWERNQEQYMASKYQTPTALDAGKGAVNFRVNQFTSIDGSNVNLPIITPNYEFKLTPYSYMYLNVKYGGAAPVSVRVTQPNVETTVPFAGLVDADIINIGSAASIRDFGDLSLIYAETASMQNAKRVKTLKLGNKNEAYDNNSFTLLETGDNALLEELDLTNISGLASPQNFAALINLKKLYAFGTNIPSISFASGGKLEYAELPALTTLTLKSLKYLADSGLKITGVNDSNDKLVYPSIVDLTIEDCRQITALDLLEACPNVVNVKLDNIHFGTKTYEYFEKQIFKLRGFEGESSNAKLTGTVHFNNLTGEQFNEIRSRYPNLVITYDALTSVIKFMDTDTTTVLTPEENQTHTRNSENKISCIELGIVPSTVTEKMAIPEFSYELFGWSTDKNEPVINYENLPEAEAIVAEATARKKYNETVLTNIEGDRVFYPVFKAIRRSYMVKFVVDTMDGDRALQESEVLYGSYGRYVGDEPVREDVDASEAIRYSFVGWLPRPEETPITGATIFRAQFIEDELGLGDIEYKLSGSTLTITSCINRYNDAVKVPSKYTINGKDYTVTGIGGFNNYTDLKLITLPDTLETFANNAFNNCTSLQEVIIPPRVQRLSQDNFSRCYELAKVILPRGLITLGATCFAWCYKLSDINLEEGLQEILSYSLYQCALSNIALPSTIDKLGELSFGGMLGLDTVTFKKRLNADGTIILPSSIHANAFGGSTVTFRVPWSKEAHIAKYGENNFGSNIGFNEAFIFNYEEENN